MSQYEFRLPDIGEGTVEAEIAAWHVSVGDYVNENQPLAEASTEKALVEITSPVSGRVLSIHGEVGDIIPVGTTLIVFETESETKVGVSASQDDESLSDQPAAANEADHPTGAPSHSRSDRILSSPAIRFRARKRGVDLRDVPGTGTGGRITRADFDKYCANIEEAKPTEFPGSGLATSASTRKARAGIDEVRVIGVRRFIARRMSEVNREVPHFSYVEEVDVTELEALRQHLNSQRPTDAPAWTYLPFIVLAMTRVLESFPQVNALYDAEREVIVRHEAVHIGIATQTESGLTVPVLRHAEARDLDDIAAEIRRLSEGARARTLGREELTGSTITLTSLGRLGGIATTPIINAPEVAIVGVNRAVERPVVVNGAIGIRRMMNLSSSFDHRFVDGVEAATMVQALKTRLEHPALIVA